MADWYAGTRIGSVQRNARREVREHLRQNPAARGSRYGLVRRIIRRLFERRKFAHFLMIYLVLDVFLVVCEAIVASMAPSILPFWAVPHATVGTDIRSLLLAVSGYFIAAQAGALGVVTLALALVTLIVQRENSDMDVKLYYHESMVFQIVASSIALLAVLTLQLLWPLQFALHHFEFGTYNTIFKFVLLGVHLIWLLANLAAVAYFIDTTFRFVQPSERQLVRKRYTANISLPAHLEERFCEQLYLGASGIESGKPSVTFGFDYGDPFIIEIETTFSQPRELRDVRMAWINWVVRHWSNRCIVNSDQSASSPTAELDQGPLLWFTPHLNYPMRGSIGWCRRRGGVSLSRIERFVVRMAFVFRRAKNEE